MSFGPTNRERINWILWEMEKNGKMGWKMWKNKLNFMGDEKNGKMGRKCVFLKIMSRMTVNVAANTCFVGTLELIDFIFCLKEIYKQKTTFSLH